jgi:hypothetical protein
MTRPKPTPNLRDPGFTPGAAHFDGLFAELAAADRDRAPQIERVLARGGERALAAVLERLGHAEPLERARLVSVLGRLKDPRASAALRRALGDEDPRVARRAANALGKLDFEAENAAALSAAWQSAATPLRRSLAEALGKVGDPAARALLEGELGADPELERIARQALLLLERRHSRGEASRIRTDAPLGVTLPVVAFCRDGLAELLADELLAIGAPRIRSGDSVELPFSGPLAALFGARIALFFGVRCELGAGSEADLPELIARAVAGDAARAALDAWTDGSVRYRLAFAGSGHQRALLFRAVEAIRRRRPELVNESRSAAWEIRVFHRATEPHLLLVPVAAPDFRFAYRQREVHAGSHPTLAAALARSAGVHSSDVVWDPFVGSGLELVERSKLGPYQRLIGSDLDPSALDAARENLVNAGVSAELLLGDATRLEPAGVSLILSNPPMGRRLLRDRSLGALLDRFVAHAARVLVPGGRLVWLSPLPEQTHQRATTLGLRSSRGPEVDLGGFGAELQLFRRA